MPSMLSGRRKKKKKKKNAQYMPKLANAELLSQPTTQSQTRGGGGKKGKKTLNDKIHVAISNKIITRVKNYN